MHPCVNEWLNQCNLFCTLPCTNIRLCIFADVRQHVVSAICASVHWRVSKLKHTRPFFHRYIKTMYTVQTQEYRRIPCCNRKCLKGTCLRTDSESTSHNLHFSEAPARGRVAEARGYEAPREALRRDRMSSFCRKIGIQVSGSLLASVNIAQVTTYPFVDAQTFTYVYIYTHTYMDYIYIRKYMYIYIICHIYIYIYIEMKYIYIYIDIYIYAWLHWRTLGGYSREMLAEHFVWIEGAAPELKTSWSCERVMTPLLQEANRHGFC